VASRAPNEGEEDVSCAVAVDAFDFAMKAERQTGRVIARPFFQ
jgi:hypothetical protein